MSDKKLTEIDVLNSTDYKDDDYLYVVHNPNSTHDSHIIKLGNLVPNDNSSRVELTAIKQIEIGYCGILILTENGKVYGNRGKNAGTFLGLSPSQKNDGTFACYGLLNHMPRIGSLIDIDNIKVYGQIAFAVDDYNKVYWEGQNASGANFSINNTPNKNAWQQVSLLEKLYGIPGGSNDSTTNMPCFGYSSNEILAHGYNEKYNIMSQGTKISESTDTWDGKNVFEWQKVPELSEGNYAKEIINIVSLGGGSPTIAYSKTVIKGIGNIYPSDNIPQKTWTKLDLINAGEIKKVGIGYQGDHYVTYACTQEGGYCKVYALGYKKSDTDNGKKSFRKIKSVSGTYKDFKIEQGTVPMLLLTDNNLYQFNITDNEWENIDNVDAILSTETCTTKCDNYGSYIRKTDGFVYAKGYNGTKKSYLGIGLTDSESIDTYTHVLIPLQYSRTIEEVQSIDVESDIPANFALSKGTGVAFVWGNNKKLFLCATSSDDISFPTPSAPVGYLERGMI